MAKVHTSSDHSLHDDSIHAIQFFPVEVEKGDWRSQLVLDIDHVTDWVRCNDGSFEFDVVEACLSFQDVGDVKIKCGMGCGGVNPLPFDRLERSVEPAIERGDYVSFGWTIFLNDFDNGMIRFTSVGYSLEEAREPIRLSHQMIPNSRRLGLARRSS